MAKYTASRLSGGNRVFPDEIVTDSGSLTVKIPGLFGGKSQSFPYSEISSVSVDAPMVGYSTITFYASGTRISANGFTKSEVEKIKREIESGKNKGGNGNVSGKSDDEMEHEQELAKIQAEASKSADRVRADHEIKQANAQDRLTRPWAHDDIFYSESSITKIIFPNDAENTAKTVEKIISIKRKELKDYIQREIKFNAGDYIKFMIYAWIMKIPDIIQGIAGTPKICGAVRPSMDKVQEGLKKLNQLDSNYNTSILNGEFDELNGALKEIQSKIKTTMLVKVGLAIAFWVVIGLLSKV